MAVRFHNAQAKDVNDVVTRKNFVAYDRRLEQTLGDVKKISGAPITAIGKQALNQFRAPNSPLRGS